MVTTNTHYEDGTPVVAPEGQLTPIQEGFLGTNMFLGEQVPDYFHVLNEYVEEAYHQGDPLPDTFEGFLRDFRLYVQSAYPALLPELGEHGKDVCALCGFDLTGRSEYDNTVVAHDNLCCGTPGEDCPYSSPNSFPCAVHAYGLEVMRPTIHGQEG